MSGSPPHMRGTPRAVDLAVDLFGITPAHAGNTREPPRGKCGYRDHPRTCGEHELKSLSTQFVEGSPPHMRGTLVVLRSLCDVVGITPAHAGNTEAQSALSCSHPDHPRTCGEHAEILEATAEPVGSPPHMRGTLRAAVAEAGGYRITPAHAGNTSQVARVSAFSADHPRTCGEHC